MCMANKCVQCDSTWKENQFVQKKIKKTKAGVLDSTLPMLCSSTGGQNLERAEELVAEFYSRCVFSVRHSKIS